jgi:hypothetical protein
MFAGSVTGGIPASGTDRSDTWPATCQLGDGCGEGWARGRCVVAGRDVWVEADGPGPVAVQETTVKTGAANTTVKARRVGPAQRPALASAGQPILVIPIVPATSLADFRAGQRRVLTLRHAQPHHGHGYPPRCGYGDSSSVRVTGRSPRLTRPRKIAGKAVTVLECPRCRLTIDPGRVEPSTVDTIASGPGSV